MNDNDQIKQLLANQLTFGQIKINSKDEIIIYDKFIILVIKSIQLNKRNMND